MATYTSNYGWTKPSGSDNVDISVLNDNLDDQDSTIHDAFLNMAPPFSESSTYAVDDIVLYGTGLYKCHTAVVTPGSWTGSTNWQVYKLSEGGSGGGGTFPANKVILTGGGNVEDALDEVMSDKTIADGIQPTLLAGQNYGVGCYYFKIGCFIYLYISVVFNSAPTNVAIFTLPEGYRPLLGGEIVVSGGESYNAKAQCMISANGSVVVSSVDKYVSGSGILLAKANT